MPKFTKLEPIEPDQEFVRKTIHFNRKQWDTILEIARGLGYDDISSVVKESIRLALIYLRFKEQKVKELKEVIAMFNLKERDLFG